MKRLLGVGAALLMVAGVANATVFRVRQTYSNQGGKDNFNLANTVMPDYIEPAAAAASAVFGGTTANDTWNSWDMDVRNSSVAGYNYIGGSPVYGGTITTLVADPLYGQPGHDNPYINQSAQGAESYETLFSGDLASTALITSTVLNSQHNPWNRAPNDGGNSTLFQSLLSSHGAGNNKSGDEQTFTVEISGLANGMYDFYSYAYSQATGDKGYYYIALNGAAPVTVTGNNYIEGGAGSGVLLSTMVAANKITIVYTAAGIVGPAFQFGTADNNVPEPGTWLLLGGSLLGMLVGVRKIRK